MHDYFLKKGHPIAEQVSKFLEDRQAELAAAIAALEAQKKAKKLKKGEPEPEINAAEYKLLPKELLVKMIELRVEQEDCNAGAIFDSLTSEHWTDEKFAISCISEALPRQNVQVLLFNFHKETQMAKDNTPIELDVCTNYRYSRRHDASLTSKKEEEKIPEAKEVTTPKAKTNKNPKFQSSPKKIGKGQQAEVSEETILAEQEKARKKAEIEAAIKDAAEAKKDKIRPKDYSEEEKRAWRAIANSYQDFVGEMAQKQITKGENAPE